MKKCIVFSLQPQVGWNWVLWCVVTLWGENRIKKKEQLHFGCQYAVIKLIFFSFQTVKLHGVYASKLFVKNLPWQSI